MSQPRILGLDVETLPGSALIWRLGKQYIGLPQLLRPTRLIMVGAKWFGTRSPVMVADERSKGGALGMLKTVHGWLAEADAIVTYNGDSFDLPWLMGEMMEHRLPPLPPVTSIDLYKTVRKCRFASNKLAYIAPLLQIGEKVKTEGLDLWVRCLDGDERAWADMRRYNKQDVRLLETGYFRMRPYIPNHPRFPKSDKDRPNCKYCGSKDLQFRGTYRTKTMTYDRAQCQKCGGWDNKLNGRRT